MTTQNKYSKSWLWMALASTPLAAWSDVDLLTGGFRKVTWDPLGPEAAKIRHRRSYKSRSLSQDHFGFGWCSEFEKKLRFENQTNAGPGPGAETRPVIQLEDCENSQVISFHPATAMKPTKNLTTSYLSAQGEKLELRGTNYVYQNKNNEELTFNNQGQLILIKKNLHQLHLEYSKDGRIQRLRINQRKKEKSQVLVQWNSDKSKIIELQIGHVINRKFYRELTLQFKYAQQDLHQVIRVSNQDSQVLETYQYDETHNMTDNMTEKMTGNQREQIRYDLEKDIVLEVESSDLCKIGYRYLSEQHGTQTTESVQTCPGERPTKERVQFALSSRARIPVQLSTNQRIDLYQLDLASQKLKLTPDDRRATQKNRQAALHE